MKHKNIIFTAILVSTLPIYSMIIVKRGPAIIKPQNMQQKMGNFHLEDIEKKIRLQQMADLSVKDLYIGAGNLNLAACLGASGMKYTCGSLYCGNCLYSDDKNGIDESTAKKNRSKFLQECDVTKGIPCVVRSIQYSTNTLATIEIIKKEVKNRIVNFHDNGKEYIELQNFVPDLEHREKCLHNKVRLYSNFLLQDYYAQAAKIGSVDCSTSHQASDDKCNNPVCCRELNFGVNTFTYDQWVEVEEKRQKMKISILEKIDNSPESRFDFAKRADAAIHELSVLYIHAHKQWKAGGDFEEYAKVRDLINYKHDCLLSQLRMIEEGNHDIWKQCQKLSFDQLVMDAKQMELVFTIINISKLEPVSQKAKKLLADREGLLNESMESKIE